MNQTKLSKTEVMGKIIIPSNVHPWPHEMRVARILASAGHIVEFLPGSNVKTADILLDGAEFEIKSPITNKPDKLERNIKRALKQSGRVIYDASRIKGMSDFKLLRFLQNKATSQPQIKKMIFISKRGEVIDLK